MTRSYASRLIFTVFLLCCALITLPAFNDFYWEYPETFSTGISRFPATASNGVLSVTAWQSSVSVADGQTRISVSLGVKRAGGDWLLRETIAGPFLYTGTEPAIVSAAVDSNDQILVALAASSGEILVLRSQDDGRSFSSSSIPVSAETAVAPKISVRADGGYILFVTRGEGQTLSLFYSLSDDGQNWSALRDFVRPEGMGLNFLPSHAVLRGTDYVVFQSFSGTLRPTFQLWLVSSTDGCESWSSPQLLTGFEDPFATGRRDSEYFDNQRPHLSSLRDRLFLVWERRSLTGSPQVYGVFLDGVGTLLGDVERISPQGAYSNNPIGFALNDEPHVLWYDNRRGQNRVYMAQRNGIFWEEAELSGSIVDASFARVIADSDGAYIFWQAPLRGQDRLYILKPDRSVSPVRISAVNFSPSKAVRRDTASIRWTQIDDPSGIDGYNWLWSRNPEAQPEKRVTLFGAQTSASGVADEDGSWYFSVIAKDYAGNWSKPSRIEFIRDTTPPGPPSIQEAEVDEEGYLLSNTLTLSWDPPDDKDVVSWLYNLRYLGAERVAASFSTENLQEEAFSRYPQNPPSVSATARENSIRLVNRDDGLWALVVSAVDHVGNVGVPAVYYFRTNKYIPYTYTTWIDANSDPQGILSVRIVGRGFSVGGLVSTVYIDRDGRAPWDREFTLSRGDYTVRSDREITGIRTEDLEEGVYRVALVHPERGLYLSPPAIRIDESGTAKFGDFSRQWQPSWQPAARSSSKVDPLHIVIAVTLLFGALVAFAAFKGMADVLTEARIVRTQVRALLTGDSMPEEKKARLKQMKRRGVSLRLKLAAFTTLLAAVVVVMVSVPLGVLMTRTQEQTLLSGLRERSAVLLESLSSGARAYLPSQNLLELGFLPDQTSAVPEAQYATITGFSGGETVFNDHVWASNDPQLLSKLDTAEYRPGVSRIEDSVSVRLEELAKALDAQARAEVGEISAAIAELTQEGRQIALRTDAESVRRREEIQTNTRALEERVNQTLARLSKGLYSEPAFPEETLSETESNYIFFKPVLYRQGSEDVYFRGLVRLEVSTATIKNQLFAARIELLKITMLIALAALGMGIAGALVLSTIIISPVKKLAGHVEMIRDTENKAELEGKDIQIRTRDEIAVLADTINQMTHGLVKAAQASQDLTIGKEVQKMFIPLDTDSRGRKLTSGKTESAHADFFGYYEGAKGVSGDYFDYLQLDDTYFALIKCDVAGKGVPAALIMIEVATLFLNFFKNWKATKEGLRIERVVYQINDFIETRGFKGRFAAFTLCLYNSRTGEAHFCNAGDNLVHWYDASEGKLKIETMKETPTAGVFPNDLIELKGGYEVQTLKLDKGDMLLLYTDGVEEAKRRFRDSSYKEMVCTEGNAEVDTPHGNHSVGQADEELGYDRIQDIVRALMTRGRYQLVRYHTANPDERLEFDFSDSSGTIDEMIMALISVEKVFRMYKNPASTAESRVMVDRKVDQYLKTHFLQYRDYCSQQKDHPEFEEYLYYTYLEEDAQYDDLTVLGLCRK